MSKTALTFSSLTKDYGRSAVLNAVSFEVAAGEFFGLVGVNGAGKTTLLKCMLDLCAADSGNIEIFGRSHRDNAARQRLSFLPERFYPPYFLTGENSSAMRYASNRSPMIAGRLNTRWACSISIWRR